MRRRLYFISSVIYNIYYDSKPYADSAIYKNIQNNKDLLDQQGFCAYWSNFSDFSNVCSLHFH